MTFAASKPQDQPPIYPVLWNLHDFYADLHQYTQQDLSQRWIYYTQPTHISIANAQVVHDDLANYRSHISGNLLSVNGITDVAIGTDLDHTIADIEQQQSLLALPLYVVAAQIVGLALLFVAAMAGLLIEGQSSDIATLKSRGMSGMQILGIYVTQGTILGVLAAIAGPFLAAVLALSLVQRFLPGATTAIAGVGAAYFGKIASPAAAIWPAIAGAVLGVGTIAFASLNAARLEVLAFRREQARPTRQPLWRRYYLDLGLVALCLVGYYELGQFGGADTRAQLGGSGANPLLLASPALLLLAGALVVLRAVPLAAALGERVAARGRGITSMLAFAQVERSPNRYTRMTLLLVLSVGLGLFALTFDASLGQNVHDRVAYGTGADIRTIQNSSEAGVLSGRISGQIKQLPGVRAITAVYRTQASTTLDEGDRSLEMLAIDPASFATVADPVSWRSDYADHSLDSLLGQMRGNLHGKMAGTPGAPIWALISQSYANIQHLKAGDRFALMVAGNSFSLTSFVVGGVVQEFPTLYPQFKPGGFLVVPYSDVLADVTRETPETVSTFGPNEFWLNVTSPAAQPAVVTALNTKASTLDIASLQVLSDNLDTAQTNPVSAGMRGLLLVGALTAALLAILGSIVQSVLAARQRTTQFAILRTIGMANRQITGLLLGEQVVVYLFGLVGGTVLGLLLTSATLPFLQFSDTTVDTTKLGIPAYQLIFNPHNIAIFYAALIVAFVIALVIAARYAANIGLGKALRLGED
jgi:putative ABC transport system permease protein